MINLLSRTEQKRIYQEYLLRIGAIIFFVLGILGALFILLLIPSYMRLKGEAASIESTLAAKRQQTNAEDQGQATEAKEFLREIQILQSQQGGSSPTKQLENVLNFKPSGVVLTGFLYDTTDSKKKFSIQGKADRREDLLLFKDRLEKEGGYEKVNIPAQTLVKRTDIQFALDLSQPDANTSPAPAPAPVSTQPKNSDAEILP
jgi:hypothetical protein